MMQKTRCLCILLGASMALMTLAGYAYAQEPVSQEPIGEQVTIAQQAATSAQQSAETAQQSAKTAQMSATLATVVWLFSPLSIALPALVWWVFMGVLILFDGFFLCRNASRIFDPYDRNDSFMFFAVQLLVLLFGLSWLGVLNPALLVIENRELLVKILLYHFGIGLLFSAGIGVWDLYFKYYLVRKRKIADRSRQVREETLQKLKARSIKQEEFNPQDPAYKQQIRSAIEDDPERKDLLRRLRVSEYAPRYIFMGVFWELFALWRFVFQYVVQWAELFANLGQVIADHYNNRLKNVGLDD